MDVKSDWQQDNSQTLIGEPCGNRLFALKTIAYNFFDVCGRSSIRLLRRTVQRLSRLPALFEWPCDCCLCREPEASGAICSACRALITVNKRPCRFCACPSVRSQQRAISACAVSPGPGYGDSQKLPDVRLICEECNIEPPLYDSAVVPYLYRFPADQLVLQLKFHDSPGAARAMAQLMIEPLRLEMQRTGLRPDFLVPVPLLPVRFRLRGFNQSLQLCLCLSAHLNIPVHETALGRIGCSAAGAQSQTGLDRESRLSAGHLSFSAADVSGLRLLLVDDVMTTGATFDNAAASLLDAGARSVAVCAFARTPR